MKHLPIGKFLKRKGHMNTLNLISPTFLVGIEIRTNNLDELSANGKIPKLWELFFKDDVSGKIKNKVSENIYGVYSNYESDHMGEYDYFIGFEVKDTKLYTNNSKLITKKIEQGKYSVVTTEKGSMQKVIPAAWEKIWKMSPSDLGGNRAFNTDYEIYTTESNNLNEATFNIYLGLVD